MKTIHWKSLKIIEIIANQHQPLEIFEHHLTIDIARLKRHLMELGIATRWRFGQLASHGLQQVFQLFSIH